MALRACEKPEYQAMRYEQGWHDSGRNEKGGAEHPGVEADPSAFIEGDQEVGRAPHVEHPHHPYSPGRTARKCDGRNDCEYRCNEVAVCGRGSK